MSRLSPLQVPAVWVPYVDGWLLSLRARGLRPTSIEVRRRHLGFALRSLPEFTPDVLGPDPLVRWAAQCEWSPETRKAYYATFRSFLEWAKKTNVWVPSAEDEEIPRLMSPSAHARPLPQELVTQLLGDGDLRVQIASALSVFAGLRRTELVLVNLRCDLVEDVEGESLLIHGKGGKQRVVPLSQSLERRLRTYREQTGVTSWLFPGQIDGHMSATWMGKLISQRLPKPWTLHCLRHRFATDLYHRSGDLAVVQQLLGHSSLATTQRYLGIPVHRLRRAVNLLG